VSNGPLSPKKAAQAAQRPNAIHRIVIALHVYEVGVLREIPPIDWGDGFVAARGLCFDKPALDPETEREIGKVTECFADVNEVGTGLAVRNASFIHLPGGTIVARHHSTLQPMFDGKSPATHVIGAASALDDLNIVAATGRFRGMVGRARIVGTLNLEHFRNETDGAIKFVDWIYMIELWRP
jgi:hypothetical protein